MTIELLKRWASADFNYPPNRVVDVPESIGKSLVASGQAKPVEGRGAPIVEQRAAK